MKDITRVTLDLPDWISSEIDWTAEYLDDEAKMGLAVLLSRLNVENNTGGPFGAAIFGEKSGKLISVGVNRVVPENCSIAHAEMMACMFAQARLETARLSDDGEDDYVLASSAQPCSMCVGALPWTGITRLIYGANRDDVESIVGFDEGPLHVDWTGELEKRGIKVRSDVLRSEACEALRAYSADGGTLY